MTVRTDVIVTVSTAEMAALAGRLGAGRATAADMQLAELLVMALVRMLPPDSSISLPAKIPHSVRYLD